MALAVAMAFDQFIIYLVQGIESETKTSTSLCSFLHRWGLLIEAYWVKCLILKKEYIYPVLLFAPIRTGKKRETPFSESRRQSLKA